MEIDLQDTKAKTIVYKSTRDCKFKGLDSNFCSDTGLPDSDFTMVINGGCGTGKSLFTENLVRQFYSINKGKKTVWSYIAYCCPEASLDSYENSFVKDLNSDDVYDSLDTDILNEILDKAIETKESGTKKNPKHSLLILDDLGSELKQGGRDGGVLKLLKKTLQTFRHMHLSVIICTQNIMSMHSHHRNIVRNLIQFKSSSIPEIERIWLEFGSKFTKKEFIEDFWPFIFDEKYNFLQVDRHNDFQMCKNYNILDIKKI